MFLRYIYMKESCYGKKTKIHYGRRAVESKAQKANAVLLETRQEN